MSEPTREQIKEAFKKTIERWERIVEDVEYFERSHCELCPLFHGCSETMACPIAIYTKETNCVGTPYLNFWNDKTPANALAELNFLRKVYIGWMEGEGKDKQEEKKYSVWNNITEELIAKIYACGGGYSIGLHHRDFEIAIINNDGVFLTGSSIPDYRIEKKDSNFIIFKKL